MTIARSRFIRPEFFTDEKTGSLSAAAQVLFIGSWTRADLNGVCEWSAKQFRAQLFPYRDGLREDEVRQWMDEIEGMDLVRVFCTEGRAWAHVVNFQKHQTFTTGERNNKRVNPTPINGLFDESNHGQTDVRPGSDSSLTPVRPGSDSGQTPVRFIAGATPTPTPPPPPPPPPAQSDHGGGDDETLCRKLSTWVRWSCADRVKTADNRAELANLIRTYGLKTVQAIAERLQHRNGSKIWPDGILPEIMKAHARPTLQPEDARYSSALTIVKRIGLPEAAKRLGIDLVKIESALKNNMPACQELIDSEKDGAVCPTT